MMHYTLILLAVVDHAAVYSDTEYLSTGVIVCVHVQQDGSVLQTVVAGSGAIQNIVWIPDVGVAVCSNRSKVRRLDPIQIFPCFLDVFIYSLLFFVSRMCWL